MYTAIVFLPLFGAMIAGAMAFSSPEDEKAMARIDKTAQWVACGAMMLSALLAINMFADVAFGGKAGVIHLLAWIDSGTLEVSWALRLDTLSAVMLLTVSITSTVIHVYSIGYMGHDSSVPRFMSYLSLFTFCMYMLVTSDNLVQLFFGWEGVGLMSYLLIGFWYDKPSANAAAIKAFVVNRVGDFGFALGIFATFVLFDSVNFDTIFAVAPGKAAAVMNVFGIEFHALTVICLLLFVGAMGKSAQLGLHTWLPDAMEGPTPVSALIHAATMVTAGVFMVARLSPLFEYSDTALAVVTVVGGSTAIFAATIGCVQNDIKRVIAYSTCSQLGYMFFAIGVSAYSAGVFHLMTHAYFKALLFLGSGSVIHAMSDEQDMRRMGGIWKSIPVTYAMMWIGSLALVGIPPFAGFYSKDIVLEAAYAAHTGVGAYAFWMGIAAATLTAFYSGRLLFMTFHGKPRADAETMSHIHESPKVMLIPLLVLSVGAMFAGKIGYDYFVGHNAADFWGASILILPVHDALEAAHHVPTWVKYLPLAVGGGGIFAAFVMYVVAPGIPGALAGTFSGVYKFLLNKWYFDELYDFLFVRPAFMLGRGFWKSGDGALIDGVGPDGVAAATLNLAKRASQFQSGYLYHYAFAMLAGVVVLITWYLFMAMG
ncbi:MAG: NADH-quinone oxidoreductase subunit L [Rhodospirillales bacterium RIFCSPLOWO2_12_FULL_58_28]|nr:MAG: NADH-quinone oxidoreductase subunit L [Rhodospirillales bacterium RIFCSPLOWO2_02_FULL_58_16]OHC79054.1 MAG: NADH-quinone oxidoreductase subunit L [Rhodospirillales bacterium RIFCSPLOWO2_12_FULL_58_28]